MDRFPEGNLPPCNGKDDLLERFNAYFRVVPANTPSLIEAALALRYQVYCLERKFEDADQHADGLERDAFDRRSVHGLVVHQPSAEAIGTARLILPEPRRDSLPIQQLLRQHGLRVEDHFPSDTAAEISRFAISKQFRRRGSDAGAALSEQSERRSNLPCLGLIQILLRHSVDLGVNYWAAVMEPQLLRMLASMGVRFHPIGPLISHHGLRQPGFCYLPDMLRELARTKPDHWAVVTNRGQLAPNILQAPAATRAVA